LLSNLSHLRLLPLIAKEYSGQKNIKKILLIFGINVTYYIFFIFIFTKNGGKHPGCQCTRCRVLHGVALRKGVFDWGLAAQ
jgi:hypothetical protein